MIVALDFDDTLFEYVKAPPGETDYSGRIGSIGKPRIWLINWAKRQRDNGHKLILWTCREGDALAHALNVCGLHGLEFDEVNENIVTAESVNWPNSRKIKADIYIDDKGVSALQWCSLTQFGRQDL